MRTESFSDDWEPFEARSLFGEGLVAQGKRDESQSLLTTGYEGLKERSDKIPCYLRRTVVGKAADRLLSLANNQQDDIFIANGGSDRGPRRNRVYAKKKRPSLAHRTVGRRRLASSLTRRRLLERAGYTLSGV